MIDIKELLLGMVPYTQYISFGLLVLSGLSLPISEDIVFILSASIAATAAPENRVIIFIGCFLGAITGDTVAYFLGRYGLNKILFNKFFERFKIINREKIEGKIDRMREYFNRYGRKTIFFGRFIPFGARNAIFMTCGLIRMKFLKFILTDLAALTCTSAILFSLGYTFGNKYEIIFPYLQRYKFIMLGIIVMLIIILLIRRTIRGSHPTDSNKPVG